MMKSFFYLILLVVLLSVTGTKSQSDYEIDIQNDCESSPPPGVSNKNNLLDEITCDLSRFFMRFSGWNFH